MSATSGNALPGHPGARGMTVVAGRQRVGEHDDVIAFVSGLVAAEPGAASGVLGRPRLVVKVLIGSSGWSTEQRGCAAPAVGRPWVFERERMGGQRPPPVDENGGR